MATEPIVAKKEQYIYKNHLKMEPKHPKDRRMVVYEPFLFTALILLAGIAYLIFKTL